MTTQGTKVFFVDPTTNELVQVVCPTSVTVPRATREQVDVTCLDDSDRRFRPGLGNPTTATFSINFDAAEPSHVRLVNLQQTGQTLDWVVGLSDGVSLPTVDTSGDVTLPTTRSFWTFQGYVVDTPMASEIAADYTMEITIQMSGNSTLFPKTV